MGTTAVTLEDSVHHLRVRALALAIHRSTYYRWRGQALRYGLEVMLPQERRQPRLPNALSRLVEQRVITFTPGRPGVGSKRFSTVWRKLPPELPPR